MYEATPATFDAWAADGAEGWAYKDVLPYFMKSERLVPSPNIDVDEAVHGVNDALVTRVLANDRLG